MNGTQPFSLLIKPASADCNLRCHYCFYLDHLEFYPDEKTHRMGDDVVERLISSYMSLDIPWYGFNWQGGEPTLMGVDFFRKVVRLQQKYGAAAQKEVSNSIQTNATLIDSEFARFLKEYNFLIGVSLDGPPEVHDRYRLNINGAGSHRKVMEGLGHLINNGVDFNFLVLISQSNVEKPREIYRYLKDIGGTNFFQFIPCVEFDDRGNLLPFAITGEQWGRFLVDIFDEWSMGDRRTISIRNFDEIINRMVIGNPHSCVLENNCSQYFVVEYNGDVFPCDFFVRDEYKLGNIATKGWGFLKKSELYRKFGKKKCQYHNSCAACQYVDYCFGDCLKHRFYGSDNPRQISHLCDGIRHFYGETFDEFTQIARNLRAEMAHQ